jgi:hypothetical protein
VDLHILDRAVIGQTDAVLGVVIDRAAGDRGVALEGVDVDAVAGVVVD